MFQNSSGGNKGVGGRSSLDIGLEKKNEMLKNDKLRDKMTNKGEQYKNEGNKLFAKGQFVEAIKFYTKAIQEDPKNHIYYSNRSASYAGLNQYEEALKDAQKCIEYNNKWEKGYYREGQAWMGLKKYELAMQSYESGLKICPQDGNLKDKLDEAKEKFWQEKKRQATSSVKAKYEGNEYYKKGLFAQAIVYYDQAYNLAQTDQEKIDALNNRASCHYQIRSFAQCIADSSEVLDLDPTNIKALLRRALSYENYEKIDLALADLKKLQDLAPGNTQVTAALTRLNKMKQMKEGCPW